jgi:hypothetical protein
MEQAREMVKERNSGYIESLVKYGEEIPVEPQPASVERVPVTV